ncbi:glucose-6-phosphate dehydrogenase [Sphingobium yanoikuyae]|nr:glucose-6-phosphate dehydrogenase [Sphingobium yanoikuyae]MDV3482447.1 glucose-6-phosphate dehydrogenase [Sphingobium yanoikuyae]
MNIPMASFRTARTPVERPAAARAAKLLLFGATGDLSQRMLLPSLYGLDADELLADGFRILATGRESMDVSAFRAKTEAALQHFVEAARMESAALARFLARLDYVAVDIARDEDFSVLADAARFAQDQPSAVFLSTAPSLFASAVEGLGRAGLAGKQARLALEKPLGSDLESSRKINDIVAARFPEDRTFRIDHYLGKETVQNLIALRFANALFEPLWNAQGIEHVQITVAETVGLEGRVDYFDGAGSLRDMVQNHMLQLLALVAMEPPQSFGATAIRDEKVKVLQSLRPIGGPGIRAQCVTGQYGPGAIAGHAVPGYTGELDRASGTETFVALKAHIDNWRWKGVPFYLRTGKRLPVRKSEIVIQFKPVPHSIFADAVPLQANKLVIRLQPEETIRLLVMAREPGLDRDGFGLREVPLDLSASAFGQTKRRIAYERLLLDLIDGQSTLFVRNDEVEAQWEWIDGIRAALAENDMVPGDYTAGSWGPSAAIALAERDGASWHD